MKRVAVLGLALAAASMAQHGRAVRAGSAGAPKVHAASPSPKVQTPKAPKPVTLRPEVAARIQPLLPAGMPVETAAEGFRNRGQFIAAVHVSHNLGIPFEELKLRMTGPEPMSLGAAVHELRPKLPDEEATAAVQEAERLAKRDQQRQQEHKPETTPAAPVSPSKP